MMNRLRFNCKLLGAVHRGGKKSELPLILIKERRIWKKSEARFIQVHYHQIQCRLPVFAGIDIWPALTWITCKWNFPTSYFFN